MVSQTFGGDWTETKLAHVRAYLPAYTTALKNKSFRLMYIDAFAGTGYRQAKTDTDDQIPLFPVLNKFAKGSARIALETKPSFDRYIFVEKSAGKTSELEKLKAMFPQTSRSIEIIRADANLAIQHICKTTDWRNTRAVAFLDPCGMQVSWQTIAAIARTQSIDLWYLFPAGIGVGRMIPRKGSVPEKWAQTLDACLGGPDWREDFYSRQTEQDLFGPNDVATRILDASVLEAYFRRKLESIFAGVSKTALPLKNQNGTMMYLLFFASGNPRGARVALDIANHILRR